MTTISSESESFSNIISNEFSKKQENLGHRGSQSTELRTVHCIDFNHHSFLLGCKDGLFIFSLKAKSLMEKRRVLTLSVWDATFMPKAQYIAYTVGSNDTSHQTSQERRTINLLNTKTEKNAASLTIKEPIENIKASKGCIGIVSAENIYILNFPTLEPLYNVEAGNGLRVLFDLSLQGLTIAHDSVSKGELYIRNFTSIITEEALTQIKQSFISERMNSKRKQTENMIQTHLVEEEEIQAEIKIEAHKDVLSQIKLSPSGSKVVTASNRGTVMRIFATKNGSKLQEFRVGYDLCKIVSISFIPDGNFLACMTTNGMVKMYNVAMNKGEVTVEQLQEVYETERHKHVVYTQSNPKSFFSFLSFAFPELGDSYSFNHYHLINPDYSEEVVPGQDEKSDSPNEGSKRKVRHSTIHEVEEEDEHPDEKIKNQNYMTVEPSKQQTENLPSRNSERVPSINYLNPQDASCTKAVRSISSSESVRNSSYRKSGGSIFTKAKSNNEHENFQRPFYNCVSKLHLNKSNYLWAVKGRHLFGLKYDSFHGGEMVFDTVKKIQ